MFLTTKPNAEEIDKFLRDRSFDDFSYSEIGATKTNTPVGYTVDHNRIKLGYGVEVYERAKTAIRRWKMFDIDWVKLYYDDTPIEAGQTVAIMVSHFGFYSLNAARIVYTLDESAEIDRFGFAYGTLTEHAEIGEERFSVEFHHDSNEVWYDLYAFSKPGSIFAKIGYPLSRYLQQSFARDSKQAMLDSLANP
jgi:uncharacterized protein (UPF0548 family)